MSVKLTYEPMRWFFSFQVSMVPHNKKFMILPFSSLHSWSESWTRKHDGGKLGLWRKRPALERPALLQDVAGGQEEAASETDWGWNSGKKSERCENLHRSHHDSASAVKVTFCVCSKTPKIASTSKKETSKHLDQACQTQTAARAAH